MIFVYLLYISVYLPMVRFFLFTQYVALFDRFVHFDRSKIDVLVLRVHLGHVQIGVVFGEEAFVAVQAGVLLFLRVSLQVVPVADSRLQFFAAHRTLQIKCF